MEELFHYLGVSSYLTTLLDMTIPPFVTLSSYDKTRLEQDLYKLNAIPIYNLELINMNLRKLLLNVMSSYFFPLLNIGDTEPNIPLWLHPYLEKLKEKENLCQGLHYLYESIPMSKSHICRIFKQYLHMTPTEYVNDMRLNYAANLLANSSEEIIDICEEVGFASLSNFYHVFRKKFGDSPMKFRNNHKYKIDIKAEE